MKSFACTAAFLALCLPALAHAQTNAPLPAGVWRSEGYGHVLRVDRRRIQIYDITAQTCVRGERYAAADFHALYGHPIAITANTAILHRSPTQDSLTRLDHLPPACRRPARGGDAMLNFDIFTETFGELYPFFEERNVDWRSATSAARANVASETLFDTLSALVAPLNDGHVTISAGERAFDPDFVTAPGLAPDGAAWSWRTLRSSLRDYLQNDGSPLDTPAAFAGNRRVLYGRVGDTGYITILAEGGWAEGLTEDTPAREHAETAAAELDQILAAIGDVRTMIIDLRVNSGGFDAVAFEVLSRFSNERRLAYRKHARSTAPYDVFIEPSARRRFEGPVAVLIGANTVSAGETLALGLAALPQAQLIGQPTRGIMSDAIPKTLPNGWTYTLSIESTYTPEGELVEARGVQPDDATPSPETPADLWARDIQRALAWLRAQN
jgi:hypothetical protein